MALKSKYASKTDIPKGAEEHYVERDGEWHLDSDHEDTGALRRAKEYEARDRKKAEARIKELEGELSARETEIEEIRKGAIPKTDVEALEKSLKGKYEKLLSEKDALVASLGGQVDKHVREATVDKLAAELFDKNAAIGRPHVASRLKTVEVNGERVVKVLDANGNETDMSTEDLKKELLQNKMFAGILVGSRASGGGANVGGGGSGAPTNPSSFDAGKASPKELVAHINAKKAAGQ
jgi:arsenate reductase-like glutaredoxin family protein